jgi:uncharacterized membrane protein YkoI
VKKRTKLLIVGSSVLAIAAGSAGIAFGTGASPNTDRDDAAEVSGAENDSAEQVTGSGADRARTAALKITGGGTANAVERDSENGATWEVEVTKPDGNTVDVRLDENYKLVVIEDDSE